MTVLYTFKYDFLYKSYTTELSYDPSDFSLDQLAEIVERAKSQTSAMLEAVESISLPHAIEKTGCSSGFIHTVEFHL